MKSVKHRVEQFEKRFPDLSTFVVFGYAVEDQNICEDKLRRWLKKLVNPEDYRGVNYRSILKHFKTLTDFKNP